MVKRLPFFLAYAWNDLRIGGKRSLFVILCVAVGVAAVVSLQTLGAMIDKALIGSLQEVNRGDIRIDAPETITPAIEADPNAQGYFASGGRFGVTTISQTGIDALEAWFLERDPNAEFAYEHYFINNTAAALGGITPVGKTSIFAQALYFNFDAFPLYGEMYLTDGRTINDVMLAPTDIVITSNLAEENALAIGDQVTVSGAGETRFTIRGLLDIQRVEGAVDIGAAILGAYYVNTSAIPLFDDYDPNRASNLYVVEFYIKLPAYADPDAAEALAQELRDRYPYLDIVSTADTRAQNQAVSDVIERLVLLIGLLALVIGGVGIINTMLVVVARRTTEIAILKTLGLKGGEITRLFLIEALMIGSVGSVVGIGLGLGVSRLLQDFAENLLAQPLTWVFSPVIAGRGIVLGVVITGVFGLLPTLIAGQVRPSQILRPSQRQLPRAGLRQTLLTLGVAWVVLALIVWSILGFTPLFFVASLGGVAGVFGLGALFFGLAWLLLGGMKRLPAFGSADVQIALRMLQANRYRVVSSMLALVVGVLALGVLTMLTLTMREQFQLSLVRNTGGNAFIFATPGADWRQRETEIAATLNHIEGVNHYTLVTTYRIEFVELIKPNGERLTTDDLIRRMNQQIDNETEAGARNAILGFTLGQIDGRSVSTALPDKRFSEGNRQLRPGDAGQRVVVVTSNLAVRDSGIEAGDILVFDIQTPTGKTRFKFTVVGVSDETLLDNLSTLGSPLYAPIDSFGEVQPDALGVVVDVDDAQFDTLRATVSAEIPGTFVIDTRLVNDLVNKIINRFVELPILVSLLVLFSSGTVIANSVALNTLERRRDIALMKALGVQRERVLGMLLLENGLLGLGGGLLGIGIAALALIVVWQGVFGVPFTEAIPLGMALALVGGCMGVGISAALITAWQASGRKPLDTLRDE